MWKTELDPRARKDLKKIHSKIALKILKYLQKNIATSENPRRFGKPLSYDKYGLWSYRIQDVRVICKIYTEKHLVLVVRIGHRKDVYR